MLLMISSIFLVIISSFDGVGFLSCFFFSCVFFSFGQGPQGLFLLIFVNVFTHWLFSLLGK